MTLRVALVGYGLAGAVFHAPLIEATPGMAVTAVVTTDPERRARVAARIPDAARLDRADEIWEAPGDYDLVVVASTNRTHVPLAMRAVEAGLPVVVDKPVAATVADATRLLDAARARDVPVAVFQNRRWDGDFLTLRSLLEAGTLGRVHRFESRFERWRPEVATTWRESPDPADAGGALYDLGSHLLDQALAAFGPVTSVYAELRAVRPGAQVDDDAFVACAHANGTVSHCWMSLVAADPGPRLRVLGDRGAYVKHGLDVQEAMLRSGTPEVGAPGWAQEPPDAWGHLHAEAGATPVPTEPGSYERFYALVADALARGAAMPVQLEETIAGLQLIEAAQRSARQHAVVGVDPAS